MKVRITDLMDSYYDESIHLTPQEQLPHKDDNQPATQKHAARRVPNLRNGLLIAASLLLVISAAFGLKLAFSHGAEKTPIALEEGSIAEETEIPQTSAPQTTVNRTITTDQNFYSQAIDQLPIMDFTGLEGTVTSIMVTADYAVFDFQLDQYGCGNEMIDSSWETLIDRILQQYLIVETTDGEKRSLSGTNLQAPVEFLGVGTANYEVVCNLDADPEEIAFISVSENYFFDNLVSLSEEGEYNTLAVKLEIPFGDSDGENVAGFAVNLAAGTYTWSIAALEAASIVSDAPDTYHSQDYVRAVNSMLDDFHAAFDDQIFLLFENGDRLPLKSGVISPADAESLIGTGTICEADATRSNRDFSTITGVEICGETYALYETINGEVPMEADIPESTSGDTDGDGILTAEIGLSFPHLGTGADEDTIASFEVDPETSIFAWYTQLPGTDLDIFTELNNETALQIYNYLLEHYFANAYLVSDDGTRIQLGIGDMVSCYPETQQIRAEASLAAAGVEGWESLTWDHLEMNGESYAFH